ncbi:hypothetical protein CHQ57_17490 [Aeromonas salmonicida]|nr:hypothetical protein CHQ57_17490 [Aeromonas salmonicida]
MPLASVTTRVTVLPGVASVVPVMVGVVSLVLSGASTVMDGAVLSTLPSSVAVPVLPAGSVTLAVTV